MGGRGSAAEQGYWAGLGVANKQVSTMPNVAVGWFSSSLGGLGALWEWEIWHMGAPNIDTPIWDIFARQREQGQAGNPKSMRVRSPPSPIRQVRIRQVVPVGLLGLDFAVGLVGLSFSYKKK